MLLLRGGAEYSDTERHVTALQALMGARNPRHRLIVRRLLCDVGRPGPDDSYTATIRSLSRSRR